MSEQARTVAERIYKLWTGPSEDYIEYAEAGPDYLEGDLKGSMTRILDAFAAQVWEEAAQMFDKVDDWPDARFGGCTSREEIDLVKGVYRQCAAALRAKAGKEQEPA